MNLRRLQAFRAVFEAGSITRAAERLHTAQPAVSRLINDLEVELGLALFVRRKRRLLPTEEGRTFYHEAAKALTAVLIEGCWHDVPERRVLRASSRHHGCPSLRNDTGLKGCPPAARLASADLKGQEGVM